MVMTAALIQPKLRNRQQSSNLEDGNLITTDRVSPNQFAVK
jgi:hypothetical protein